jgi:hypothetical protein
MPTLERAYKEAEAIALEAAALGSLTPEQAEVLLARRPDGALVDRTMTWDQLAAARVPENDGKGLSPQALAGTLGKVDAVYVAAAPVCRACDKAAQAFRPSR